MKTLSTLALILLSSILFAQKDFKPGYVITNDMDTVSGFIYLKNNVINARECWFKKDIDGELIKYFPSDITAYKLDNSKYYVSKVIQLNGTDKKVFLEFLVEGIVNLYYYKDIDISGYFYVEKDGVLNILSNEEKVKITNRDTRYSDELTEYVERDTRYAKSSNQYKGVLLYLFRDSPELSQQINNTPFEYRSLINLTEDYHNNVCDDACIVYKKETYTSLTYEALLGANFTQIKLMESTDVGTDFTPMLGLNLYFSNERVYNQIKGFVGLHFSSLEINQTYNNPTEDKRIGSFDISMQYYKLSIPIGINYTFTFKEIKPFIGVAYNNVFLLNSANKVDITYKDDLSNLDVFPQQTYQMGFISSIGLKKELSKKNYISLKIEYEYRTPRRGVNSNPYYVLTQQDISEYRLSIGYGIGGKQKKEAK